MPRQARIDAPGALHHIICRGIERRTIFRDNKDRNRIVERLGGFCFTKEHYTLLCPGVGSQPLFPPAFENRQ